MVKNLALIFKKVPSGWPVIGEHLAVEDIGYDPSAPAPTNGLVVELHSISYDPYLRGRMREPDVGSYNSAFTPGKPMENAGIGKVLKSNVAGIVEGDTVRGHMPFAQYAVLDEAFAKMAKKLDNAWGVDKVRQSNFLGALGMPGLTAYSSLYEIGKPKKGEVILVSAASGAVGQIVGQLAKHEGLTVYGSVGSDEKLEYITKTLGFDGGFNYKKESPRDALARLAPDGIDIYYDNVGGEHVDAALDAARNFARFVMCGSISGYSLPPDQWYGVKNMRYITAKRITMRGFIVVDEDMGPRHTAEHQRRVGGWIADGSFKVAEHETRGMENAAQGFLDMLNGKNFGKAYLNVKEA